MTVHLVGAGPGDPGLITARGLELVRACDVLVADVLVSQELIDEAPEDAIVVSRAGMKQEEVTRLLVAYGTTGLDIVRLKGGDPFVFGRGGEEVLACLQAGVPVTVVPGVTSSIAAPALAGIPVTHRGVAHEFSVVSGHVPPESEQSLVDWGALARLRGTLVIMMGLKNLPAIAARLLAEGRAGDTPAAVVQEGSTDGQRVLRGTLASIADAAREAGIRPPAVVVLGDVVTTLS